MKRKILTFLGPRRTEVSVDELGSLRPDQVAVQTELSAISAGTEMLVYRGEIPEDADNPNDPITQDLRYPTPFGYAVIGRVMDVGAAVDPTWLGRRVFAFQSHTSHFAVTPQELVPVPEGLAPEDAVFLANAETAVSLVQDASPVVGDAVLVLGQGVVGLLTAALLHEFPLQCLVTADLHEKRRLASTELGATAVLDPAESEFQSLAFSYSGSDGEGYDISLELTGNPVALNSAISLTRYGGRVVVGSWYGTKAVPLNLGGRFHRSRITMVASQVSTIAGALAPRWSKSRRFAAAWEAIRRIRPGKWITQRFPFENAADAYQTLDLEPGSSIQIVLQYT